MSREKAYGMRSACNGLHGRVADFYHSELMVRERELCARTDDVYQAALASYRKIVCDWDGALEEGLSLAEQSAGTLADGCSRAEEVCRRAESAYSSVADVVEHAQ